MNFIPKTVYGDQRLYDLARELREKTADREEEVNDNDDEFLNEEEGSSSEEEEAKETKNKKRQENKNWNERLEELKEFKHQNGHCDVPQKYGPNKNLSIWVHYQRRQYSLKSKGARSSMTEERIEKLEMIGFKWNQNEGFWKERFEELKEYKVQNGHCNVPCRYERNKVLGQWVHKQRSEHRLMLKGSKSSMTEERVEKLENIGFEWSLGKITAAQKNTWNNRLVELKEYISQNGHCNVPQSFEIHKVLGNWVQYQRSQYRLMLKGSKSQMTQERVEKLEEIGFEWKCSREKTPSQEDMWDQRYEQLKEYKVQNDHCNVPHRFEINKALGNWVMTQRQQYNLMSKGLKSKMTQDRVEKLENIGFEWKGWGNKTARQEDMWDQRYEQLKEYKVQNGHCNVSRCSEGNEALGRWVNTQRSEYRKLMSRGLKSHMTQDRVEKLEEIGFEWNHNHYESTWNERLEELKEFKVQHGHCNVPWQYEGNKALVKWVYTQRSHYKLMLEGSQSWMTEERVEKLENIGFEWSLNKRTACKNATVKRRSKRLRSKK